MNRPLPPVRVKRDASPRTAILAIRDGMDLAALMHLDTSGRCTPSVAQVGAVLRHARPCVVRGEPLRDALRASDPGNGIAAYYAGKLFGRLCPLPFLVHWLDEPRRTRRDVIALLDAALALFGPPAGPCAFCGLPDRRHRLLESVAENVRAGDSVAFIAEVYGVAEEAVRTAAALGRTTRRDFDRAGLA